MSLTEAQVKKIAKLTRIKLDDNEVKHYQAELSNILDWIEQLSEVDTDGVDDMTSVVNVGSPMRRDEITDGNCVDDVLANAPDSKYGYFTVPKMVE